MTAANAQAGAADATAGGRPAPDHVSLLPGLLRPFLGDAVSTLTVVNASYDTQAREWRLGLTAQTSDGDVCRLRAGVDCERQIVCSLDCFPMLVIPGSSPGGVEAAATAFARERLGVGLWGTNAKLNETLLDSTGGRFLIWTNILPRGAHTGDSCSVHVEAGTLALTYVTGFRAHRVVREDEVLVTRDDAIAKAEAVYFAGRARPPAAEVSVSFLALGSPLSPSYGPVWHIDAMRNPDDERHEVLVDGVTGDTIERPKRPPQE